MKNGDPDNSIRIIRETSMDQMIGRGPVHGPFNSTDWSFKAQLFADPQHHVPHDERTYVRVPITGVNVQMCPLSSKFLHDDSD